MKNISLILCSCVGIMLINNFYFLGDIKSNFKNNFLLICMIVFSIILGNSVEAIELSIGVIFAGFFFMYKILGNKNKRICFINTTILIMSYLLSDILSNLVTNIIFEQRDRYIYYILYLSLIFVFLQIFCRVFKEIINFTSDRSKKKNIKSIYIWANIFLCVIVIILSFILNKHLRINDTRVYITQLTLFLSTVFSSIFSAYLFNKYSLKELEINIKNEEMKNIEEYSSEIESLYDGMRKFRHDYKNILLSMNEYIDNKEYDKLEKYFKENIFPTENYINNNDFIVKLKNIHIMPLKSLLISKLMKADNNGIKTFIDIQESIDYVPIEYMDSIRIFGILLDNAIEAALETKEKILNFAIIKRENSFVFVIQNSCKEDEICIYKLQEKGFSTKGENRGLGLYNLKEILIQYSNITLNMEVRNNMFNVEVWIRQKCIS